MEKNRKLLYPLFAWAILFVHQGIFALYFLATEAKNDSLNSIGLGIFTFISVWFLASGIGVFFTRKWGMRLFKVNMDLMLIAFPLGTLLSVKTKKYIKDNKVEELFK